MERTKNITYKGVSMYFMDFSNTRNQQEVAAIIEECKVYIRSQPANSVIAITNMDNIFFSIGVKNDFISFISGNKPYLNKSSVFGLSGLARIVFNGIMKVTGRDIRSFEKMVDAQEFLINRD